MTITPCLWFDTQGEAAPRFHVSVFPDSRAAPEDAAAAARAESPAAR
jgi:predicted 3-demethylubiquinone-9 3-methyltransferase (glyoxalase superfamily)